jgi:hypothetical protein
MASRSDAVVRWGWSPCSACDGTSGPKSPPPRTANLIFVKDKNRAVLSSPLQGKEVKNRDGVIAASSYAIALPSRGEEERKSKQSLLGLDSVT